MTPLCFCGQPVADNARACQRCTDRLERDLAQVPALADELQTTITRQARLEHGTYTGTLEDPQPEIRIKPEDAEASVHVQSLPVDMHASTVNDDLRSTLVGWVRVIVEERGTRWPADTLAAMSVTLLSSLTWLRHHPAAEEAFDELQHAIGRGWAAVDRHPDLLYAGPCDPAGDYHDDYDPPGPCPTDLYAKVGERTIKCPRCQMDWDVAGRRDLLLEAAQDQLVTAADLSRFLTVYGQPVNVDRVYKWAERGRITAHGHNARSQPLYRVGDAVELLLGMDVRRSA